MCWCYHKRHFPPSFITWSFDIGKKVNYCFFLFPLGACGLFSQNVKKFSPYFECSILFAHNTHYWWIFSADTMSGCPRALYLHSQRNWQMVDDKRSIPWSCRRTASTDPRFQSLKDTEKQPNRSTAQHSARNMAGAWNICQDSLTQMGLVSKSEINPANAYGILLQRDLRATIQCKTASTTLALWLFNYKITDPSKVLLSRTQSRTACKGEEWDCTTSNEAVIQWEGDVLPIRSPLGMGLQDHSICHPRAFGARDYFIGEVQLFRVQCCINTWDVIPTGWVKEEGVKIVELGMLDLSDLDQSCSLFDSFIFHVMLSLGGKWHTCSSVSHMNLLKENVFCIFHSSNWWKTGGRIQVLAPYCWFIFLNSLPCELFQYLLLLLLKISYAAAPIYWHDSQFLLSNCEPVQNTLSFLLLQKKWT